MGRAFLLHFFNEAFFESRLLSLYFAGIPASFMNSADAFTRLLKHARNFPLEGVLFLLINTSLLSLFEELIIMAKTDSKHLFNASKHFVPLGLGFVALFLVLMASFGGVMLNYMDKQARLKAVDTAETILYSTRSSIHFLIEDRKEGLEYWANSPAVIALVKEQLKAPRNRRDLLDSPALGKLRVLLGDQMDVYGFIGFFVIAPDYTNVGSLRNANVGEQNLISVQREGLLTQVFEGESKFVPPVYSDVPLVGPEGRMRQRPPTMFIASPVKGDDGEVIAVLTGRMSVESDFNLLGRSGRISASSESYFFDETGRLISESRFEDQLRNIGLLGPEEGSVFNIEIRDPGVNLVEGESARLSRDEMPLTFMARSAIDGEAGRSEEGYNDYRGVPVLGAWLWDEELGIGMVSEIDVAEALQFMSQTRTIFIVIMIAATLLAIGLAMAMLEVRKRAELQLKRLASAVENTAESVVITSSSGLVEYVNPAYERVVGYTAKELVGKTLTILDHETPYADVWETLKSGSAWSGRFSGERRDGSSIEFDSVISPIRDSNRALLGYVLLQRDVTEQLKLEEMLRQSEKMQAIGTLAGGIAHDFNNILAGIRGHIELALDEVPEGTALSEDLQETLDASDRAADLVQQILSFSRKREDKWENIDLEGIINSSVSLLKRTIAPSIGLFTTLNAKDPIVYSDQTRLQQVLLNLCSNAAAAMENGVGRIDIELNECVVDAEFAAKRLLEAPGDYLKLVVRDTGSGIDPSVMDRIFEPFYTTKEAGSGTGLGLAQVHSIVESHRGSVEVESVLGEGTSFTIYLPRAEGAAVIRKKDEALQASNGRERIMVVDDEVTLTNIFSRALERHGYKVIVKNNPLEALEAFRADPHGYDLVITDQSMPELKGETLAVEMLSLNNRQPIILCSGFIGMLDREQADEIGIRQCLIKPVSIKVLAEAVRQVLDEKEPQRASV